MTMTLLRFLVTNENAVWEKGCEQCFITPGSPSIVGACFVLLLLLWRERGIQLTLISYAVKLPYLATLSNFPTKLRYQSTLLRYLNKLQYQAILLRYLNKLPYQAILLSYLAMRFYQSNLQKHPVKLLFHEIQLQATLPSDSTNLPYQSNLPAFLPRYPTVPSSLSSFPPSCYLAKLPYQATFSCYLTKLPC